MYSGFRSFIVEVLTETHSVTDLMYPQCLLVTRSLEVIAHGDVGQCCWSGEEPRAHGIHFSRLTAISNP